MTQVPRNTPSPELDVDGPRPRIGLSACLMAPDFGRDLFKGKALQYLEGSMAAAIWRAGGLPVLLPDLRDESASRELIASIDGLLLQGGADVAPEHYGQSPLRSEWSGDPARDRYEFALIKRAVDRRIPVLGVCRGHQVLNVALGGSLWQDIGSQVQDALVHRDREEYDHLGHSVHVDESSWVARVYRGQLEGISGAQAAAEPGGAARARSNPPASILHVNSVHHQSICEIAPGLRATAFAPDGVIEAIEPDGASAGVDLDHWLRGVQWHPEWLDERFPQRAHGDALFVDFIRAVALRRAQ